MAVLSLRHCEGFSLALESLSYCLVVVAWTSHSGGFSRGVQALWLTGPLVGIPGLWSTGSIVVSVGLSCSAACGIFLVQGSNPCLLHWQADSLPPWKPSPGLHMSTLLRERQNLNLVQAIVILEFLSYLFKKKFPILISSQSQWIVLTR